MKPISVISWLVRLITPPGGLVLDPFTGSGTAGVACIREGFRFVGIEREEEYIAIAQARIEHEANIGPAGTAPLPAQRRTSPPVAKSQMNLF